MGWLALYWVFAGFWAWGQPVPSGAGPLANFIASFLVGGIALPVRILNKVLR